MPSPLVPHPPSNTGLSVYTYVEEGREEGTTVPSPSPGPRGVPRPPHPLLKHGLAGAGAGPSTSSLEGLNGNGARGRNERRKRMGGGVEWERPEVPLNSPLPVSGWSQPGPGSEAQASGSFSHAPAQDQPARAPSFLSQVQGEPVCPQQRGAGETTSKGQAGDGGHRPAPAAHQQPEEFHPLLGPQALRCPRNEVRGLNYLQARSQSHSRI